MYILLIRKNEHFSSYQKKNENHAKEVPSGQKLIWHSKYSAILSKIHSVNDGLYALYHFIFW